MYDTSSTRQCVFITRVSDTRFCAFLWSFPAEVLISRDKHENCLGRYDLTFGRGSFWHRTTCNPEGHSNRYVFRLLFSTRPFLRMSASNIFFSSPISLEPAATPRYRRARRERIPSRALGKLETTTLGVHPFQSWLPCLYRAKVRPRASRIPHCAARAGIR